MLKYTALAFALATASFAAPAAAESRMVRYADLDLATPEGQARMERRIAGAAREVCGADGARHSALADSATRECIADAKARARAQVARLDGKTVRGG